MKLKEVIIHNFKSIAQDCTLNVDKRITSIVGASEAGKTNVLEALNKFYTEKGFDESDICSFNDEGINNDTDMVSVVFELGENDDREEISQIDERLIKAGIFTIRKRMNGEYVLEEGGLDERKPREPQPPERISELHINMSQSGLHPYDWTDRVRRVWWSNPLFS
jgi:predicted ATP-dependent endonuclease of OLD family